MNWFKKNKNKVIIGAVIAAVLVFAFWYGGDAPGLKGWKVNEQQSQQIDVEKNDDNRTASSGSEDKTDKQDKSDESVTDGSENVSKDSEEASKKPTIQRGNGFLRSFRGRGAFSGRRFARGRRNSQWSRR